MVVANFLSQSDVLEPLLWTPINHFINEMFHMKPGFERKFKIFTILFQIEINQKKTVVEFTFQQPFTFKLFLWAPKEFLIDEMFHMKPGFERKFKIFSILFQIEINQ